MDLRTDYYSLGATLYHLLTDQLPFEAESPNQLIHCHLMEQPVAPHLTKPAIPRIVSDIVMKLMQKDPGRRYQSAQGIQTDLAECLRQWIGQGLIPYFALGQQDRCERLQVPHKLYGREPEIEKLIHGFEQVQQDGSALMLVYGYSGIGKTALVKEVHKPLTRCGGTFISGKFDPLQRGKPYSALVGAFGLLCHQLLGECPQVVEKWQERLRVALGANAQVLLDVMPEFKWLLGPQQPVPELPATERQNRFHLVMEKFVGVFARKDNPLVLFLDDLQWADSASLKLIQGLLSALGIESLYLICGYRDQEVGPTHPLLTTVEELEHQGRKVDRLSLSGLTSEAVNQLVEDTVHRDRTETLPLSELLVQKSDGNPFLIIELLEALYQEGLLRMDLGKGGWTWDVERIRALSLKDNAAELMVNKIQKLGDETREVLRVCACLGGQFAAETVARCSAKPPKEILQALIPAVAEGLLLPLNAAYQGAVREGAYLEQRRSAEFRFAHDRILQAVTSLIPAPEKKALHLCIGKTLWGGQTLAEDDPRIFEIATQLNLAWDVIETDEERVRLAALNLQAGRRAKLSSAHEQALGYLGTGIQLLGPHGWKQQYALALALHDEAAEAAYLSTDFVRMEQWTQQILEQATTILDQVKAYSIRIEAMAARQQPLQAIAAGLEFLRLLGIRLAEHPSNLTLALALIRTKLCLAGRKVEDLANLGAMTDPSKLAAVHIMRKLAIPAFVNNARLMALLLFEQVRLIIRLGHTPLSGSVFGSFGIVLCGVLGDIKTGFRMGQLAQRLVDKQPSRMHLCRVNYVTNAFVMHWKQPLKETLRPFVEGYQSGLEHGDHEYAAFNAHMVCHHGWLLGQDLHKLVQDLVQHTALIVRLQQRIPLSFNRILHQMVLNLTGHAQDPCTLNGEAFDEARDLPVLQETRNRTAIFEFHFFKMILCFMFQRFPDGVSQAEKAIQYQDGAVSLFAATRHAFYDGLLRLRLSTSATWGEQRRIHARVKAALCKLKRWAQHAPTNHYHVYHLLLAEQLRVLGQPDKAEVHYNAAISLLTGQPFIHELALAQELAGEFALYRRNHALARARLWHARDAYLRWGAVAKVKELELRHPRIFSDSDSDEDG